MLRPIEQSSRPDWSIPASGDAVTAVVPADSDESVDVLATSSSDGDGLPLGDIEGLMGMRSLQNTTLTDVGQTLRSGSPSGLESLDFAALRDGTPIALFRDENGNRQFIQLTAPQWMSALSQRDRARRDQQYQIDAKAKRQEMAPQFHSLLNDSSFDDFNRQRLQLLWDISPDAAITAVSRVREHNQTRDAKTRMYGGQEVLGDEAYEQFGQLTEELGLPMPTSGLQSDWHHWYRRILDRAGDSVVMTRGRAMPAIEAAVVAGGDFIRARQIQATTDTATQTAQLQTDLTTARLMGSYASQYATFARGTELSSLPPMTLWQMTARTGTSRVLLAESLAAMSALSSTARTREILANIQHDKFGDIHYGDARTDLAVAMAAELIDQHATALGWEVGDTAPLVPMVLEALVNNPDYGLIRQRSLDEVLRSQIDRDEAAAEADNRRDIARDEARIAATAEQRRQTQRDEYGLLNEVSGGSTMPSGWGPGRSPVPPRQQQNQPTQTQQEQLESLAVANEDQMRSIANELGLDGESESVVEVAEMLLSRIVDATWVAGLTHDQKKRLGELFRPLWPTVGGD